MKISDLLWKPNPIGGERAIVTFPNGYGASILRGLEVGTYTRSGTYELAILHHNKICYTTPITSDVLGYLSTEEVEATLEHIEKLHRGRAQ